ncbi:Protein MAIN-LIKE 1 [Glycine max]|uniref:protein MAIN-LIKE 1-like n=1 Tax=Glycine max TaxID=3847 RepID=UPI0003DEB1C0|nr:protein MAIN-LIKE 1-like [Glycine max]XP_028223964.1 protein MAIN-LIKE 1-like [Glycine soja]KAH1264916.1 Protein MAIN-LIKE 1 [Glycine max]|eukprot:XP_006573995.1 protein MAIN-LIKE 1-like [Glycine max]
MVRTRGLHRVLGTGRGRDISEDVPEADVPRRRRPTASARRQRVTQRVEDVPELPEDVPHVSNGSPEMTGVADGVETDRVASDGSLGAPADDEGFPSGPHDPSVLIGFAYHVAHNIWSGHLVSHGRKVDKFGRSAAEIEGMIAATGLDPPTRCSIITTDPGLIFDFVEWWHRETSSFHLPVGEVTITLDDVSSLLHIPITGALHSFEPLVTSDAVALLTELLEVTPDEATAETRQVGGPHVRLSWLRDMYQSRCRARQWVAAARTYLLHLVGCTLFANKSATHVHVVHLQAFRDLGQAGEFSWGAAALVHLYNQLNEASQAPTRQMAGYISLLQCWIYEHFPSIHRCVVDDGYAEASPRACRWLTGKAQMTGIKGAPYRARIDSLTVTDVCWMPYAEHRGVRGYDLISSYTGQVRWGQIIVYIRPERVVRQMGYIQTVPLPPVRDSLTGTDIDDRWVHFSDHVVPTGKLYVVPGQVAPDYMEWFFQISHPFLTPTEDTVEPRPAPPPPTHDDDFVEPPVVEVSVTSDLPTHSVVDCTTCVRIGRIAEHLERVINLRMVTEGTDSYDIMDPCLRIARDDDPDDSLRPRQRPRID